MTMLSVDGLDKIKTTQQFRRYDTSSFSHQTDTKYEYTARSSTNSYNAKSIDLNEVEQYLTACNFEQSEKITCG